MNDIKVEIENGKFETFKVVPITCKVGDIIYFDDDGSYLEGVVTEIHPKWWWIYDDGHKTYGRITCECTTRESHYWGQNFTVDADDIIYTKPNEYDKYWNDDDDKGMTTDELLLALPRFIGNNETSLGFVIAKENDDIGWLTLENDGKHWCASYGGSYEYIVMNPDAKEPPYDCAICYGDTPNEALKALYDWCVKHNFIK